VVQGLDQLVVGSDTFSHTYDAQTGVHTFENDAGVYRLREWTWGAKNATSNASVVLGQEMGGFQIDTARFNEAMLAASLVEATVDGQALNSGPAALRQLKASQGDRLLGLAQWVNGLLAEAALPEPRFDPRTETYHLALDGDGYVLREWTWGEKNDVSSRSIVYDPAADTFGVDMALFNELMLQATLVEAPFDLTPEALRRLPASKGDALLAAAQRINGLAATEKKRS
jgi:hypothetical protein